MQWGGADAIVSVHQNIRWSWASLAARADAMAAGLLALGLDVGDRIGIWSPNCAEWVLTQFAAAKAGHDPGDGQPGLSALRARIHAEQGRRESAGLRRVLQDQRLRGDGRGAGAGAARRLPGRAGGGAASHLEGRDQDRRRGQARAGSTSTTSRASPSRRTTGARRDRGRCSSATDPINIQFTSGTTGLPKGATLTHRNILNNGYFVGIAQRLTAERPHLRAGAALPLLRHGDGLPRRGHARRGDGLPGPDLRAGGDAGGGGSRALHRALRRAHHVHRRARLAAVRRPRSVLAAHRDHGRRAVPGGGDAPGARPDAHE